MSQHIYSGTTAPATTPAEIGHHYVDTVAGDLYISNGTASSANWIKLSSAALSLSAGAGSPEGVLSASPGAIYTDIAVDPPNVWVKFAGAGNTNWRQLIG